MNETTNTATLPIIINANLLTPHEARYWNAKARKLIGKVDIIDPLRCDLRVMRKAFKGKRMYRASTGGRWGKSAEYINL